MSYTIRSVIGAVLAIIVTAVGATAQTVDTRPRAPEDTRPRVPDPRTVNPAVSILTDGIADGDDRAARAIEDLARRMDGRGGVRVIPMIGRGATENVRDLLYQRGVDFAVVNGDVLSYLQIVGQNPDAPRRIRYVTHLFDQRVYLLARRGLNDIGSLKGKKVGAFGREAGGSLTAKTIFALENIPAQVSALPADGAVDPRAFAGLDAVVLLGAELEKVDGQQLLAQDFRLLPIPLTPALRRSYTATTVKAGDIPGGDGKDQVETVAVPTVLAVFNFSDPIRALPVERFIDVFFDNFADLKRRFPGSIWSEANLSLRVPGWTRHPVADPSRRFTLTELAELSKSAPPPARPTVARVAPAEPLPATAEPRPAETPRAAVPLVDQLRAAAVVRPPLIDDRAGDGGLVMDLLGRSLARVPGGPELRARLDVQWIRPGMTRPLEDLIESRAIDVVIGHEAIDCDKSTELNRTAAVLCDQTVASDALMEISIGLYARNDGSAMPDLKPGRSICLPADRDLGDLAQFGPRAALANFVIRRPTTLDCIAMVQAGEAEALVATDVEAPALLQRLGLAALFRTSETPIARRGLHVHVARSNAAANDLVTAINAGIARAKQDGDYAGLVKRRLSNAFEGKPAKIP